MNNHFKWFRTQFYEQITQNQHKNTYYKLRFSVKIFYPIYTTSESGKPKWRRSTTIDLDNDPPTRLHRLDAREANSNFVVRNALWEVARTNNVNILYYLLAPANRRPHQILSVTALTLLSFKSTFKKHTLRIIFINYISQKQFLISQFLH